MRFIRKVLYDDLNYNAVLAHAPIPVVGVGQCSAKRPCRYFKLYFVGGTGFRARPVIYGFRTRSVYIPGGLTGRVLPDGVNGVL